MDYTTVGTAFVMAFTYIFLKAMQQLNVVNKQYAWIMPMSIGMGLCEVVIVLTVVKADSLYMGLVTGLGAGLGAMLAVKYHEKITRRT